MDMKNRKKTWKVFGLSLGLALVLLSTNANAQYEGNRGMFGRGESVDASPSRGIMDRGTTGSGITLQGFGENQNNLTLQNFGEEAPLGSGWLVLMGAGLGYAALKQRKTTKSKQNK